MTETTGKYKLNFQPINLDHLASLVSSLSDASDDEKVKILTSYIKRELFDSSRIINIRREEVWRLTGVKIRESLGE